MRQPDYFEGVRSEASLIWEDLEAKPELAGPWRQLFRQVQSPRHVLSELLQNADDAGATEAAVDLDDDEFIFSHNGEDFNEEQFRSLCRFGFSNKRTLHTIGFRGVGFKSTFSLGDEVRLFTPTLSVAFSHQRFTEPIWVKGPGTSTGLTEIRVAVQKEQVRQELGKNLGDWSDSPASLLFFNNIRCLRILDREIRWESHGAGPIEGSEWMSVSTTPEKAYLLVRSSEDEFPEDALSEIKDERMTPEEEADFPPCRVEIVLGMEGRLFVVLPTGVLTQLPFACNAPFIQDPARMKIKDPALSPTNSWLLKRVGELAADAMLAWVKNESLDVEDRCRAYGLLPDVTRDDNSLEGSCGAIVNEHFGARIEGKRFVLTETQSLQLVGKCMAVPSELLGVWSPAQISAGFNKDKLQILSRFVSQLDRTKLSNRRYINTLGRPQILEVLRTTHPPRPRDWEHLLRLWEYVSGELIGVRSPNRNLRIVPARGKRVLFGAAEVIRAAERRSLRGEDWEFLSPHFLAMDPAWTRFLAQQRQAAEASEDEVLKRQVRLALSSLSTLSLGEASNVDRIMSKVADSFFFMDPSPEVQDYARLTHIAAKLGASISNNFQFVTQGGEFAPGPILADVENDLDMFVSADWYKKNVLHDAYANFGETCTQEEWRQWLRSQGSRLRTFIPLSQTRSRLSGRERLRERLRHLGLRGEPQFHYRSDQFAVEDWNFPSSHWNHWKSLAEDNDGFWAALLRRILEQPTSFWSGAMSARAIHLARNGHERAVTQEALTPEWIIRFRELPCFRDTWGQFRQPAEIFRRTPETEPFLGVEPFVEPELDTEATRPLLNLLGVRDKPTGPERLLERLQALTYSQPPLVPEIQKWCLSLDQLFDRCSTEEIQSIRQALASNKLILTEQEDWAATEEVFLNTDADGIPGTVLIHPSVRELSLWRKVGVSERPTADQAIEWLKGFLSGQRVVARDAKRARSLMSSYAPRIWKECGHWLNLQDEWVPVDDLVYCVTAESRYVWSHLFPAVKAKTADFLPLLPGTCQDRPFSAFPTLKGVIEERIHGQSGLPLPQEKPWLAALGEGLKRITLDDPEQTERIRVLAQDLALTRWQVAAGLKSVPYINGTPAGTPWTIDVHWGDRLLYVETSSTAKMARVVPQEIARAFNRTEITDAIKLCYERSPDFINEYLESNFTLGPRGEQEGHCDSEDRKEPLDKENEESLAIEELPENHVNDGSQPDYDSDEHDKNEEVEPSPPRPPRPPGPSRPSVMERFAISHGFSMNGTGKFHHQDGRTLERTTGNTFPWQLKSGLGETIKYYWDKEHCIEREPLQLDAEAWQLCQQLPALYSLILNDTNNAPLEIKGSQLVEMTEQKMLILHPATYRLEYRGEKLP